MKTNINSDHIIAAFSLILVMVLFIILGVQLHVEAGALAFDWKIIWHSIDGGLIVYGDGLYNPPWSLLFLLPLGLVPVQVGWGIITALTLATLVMSLPTSSQAFGVKFALLLLVTTSYPALRLYADANVDALVIVGIWLMVAGYHRRISWMLALGVLMATIKPQAVSLLLIVLAAYSWHALAPRVWLRAGGIVAAVVLVSLLAYGRGWVEAMSGDGLPSGISLAGTFTELGLARGWIVVSQLLIGGVSLGLALRGSPSLSPQKVGLLAVGSILVSPYANGHSMVIALAVVAAPLVASRPRLGVALILLLDLPVVTFIANSQAAQNKLGHYWTGVLLICWLVACNQKDGTGPS